MKKKYVKYFVLGLVVIFLLVWGVSILHCEILTRKYKMEFDKACTEIQAVIKVEDLKVIKYSEHYAEIYYTSPHGGALVSYVRQAGTAWTMQEWKAAWSDSGSADDIIWPYIR